MNLIRADGGGEPTPILVSERVRPTLHDVRRAIIDAFAHPNVREAAKRDPDNQHCLVRVYLGSTKGAKAQPFFSLRSFKLHLNHMVELALDVASMAGDVGMALATMHWAAQCDARDVEFVLGSVQTRSRVLPPDMHTYTGPERRQLHEFRVWASQLFVLDFDQVQKITMDQHGVERAVEAAMLNDASWPKACGQSPEEVEVWRAFAASYTRQAENILAAQGEETKHLPALFLRLLGEAQENITREQ